MKIQTHDTIETLGIERTFQKLEQASIVLWVVDQTEAEQQIAQLSDRLLPLCEGKTLILVLNKSDLPHSQLSIVNKEGIDRLKTLLLEAAQLPTLSQNDLIVTNARHYEALTHALESIHRVQEGLSTHLSGDFISQEPFRRFHLARLARMYLPFK